MDATGRRVSAVVEWTLAVAVLACLATAGLWLTGGSDGLPPPARVSQTSAARGDAAPSSVPPRAVSVPLLALTGSVRIQVGEFAGDVLARIQGLVVAGADAVERGAGGERVTREFTHAGGRFLLVTEAQGDGAARVTGIFLPQP